MQVLRGSYLDEKQVLPVDNRKRSHKLVFCSINENSKRAYNVILRRVRVTSVAMEKYYMFCVCVCSLSYPTFKVGAPF